MAWFSAQYRDLAKQGPFPGRIDPWAESGRYFQQIHSGIIGHLITQIDPHLFEMGYLVGKEASLQIAEGREPDIFIQRAMNASVPLHSWDYELAAAEVLAEPGVLVEGSVDLQALHIKQRGQLVTVVEIVSPNNKAKPQLIADYQERRERLVLQQQVNVVEIDLTRSVKHLLNNRLTELYAYHVAVYIPGDSPHVIGIHFDEALKRIALPLRNEVVAVELQPAYQYAYQLVTIAAQINHEGAYVPEKLPFPSLLSDQAQHDALSAVQRWQNALSQLRP